MQLIIQSLLPLMLLIALGYIKGTIADDSWTDVLNKLAIYLLFLFFIYFSLVGGGNVLAISVLEAGMPITITPFILAEPYPMERELIELSIVISCLLSVITLPLIMMLVGVV